QSHAPLAQEPEPAAWARRRAVPPGASGRLGMRDARGAAAGLWPELEDDVDRGLGGHRYAVEPARVADEAQITAIARAHQPAGAVTMLRSWWDAMPSAFRVARDPDGSPAAFRCLCEATSVPAPRFTAPS